MAKRIGKSTFEFEKPHILSFAGVGSTMEKSGPLGEKFDHIFKDPLLNKKSWEEAESELQKSAIEFALKKAGFSSKKPQMIFAGDLLNQCIGSTFGVQSLGCQFVGLYGACSTMALSLIMAAISVESGINNNAIAVTSSHFCSAERQYRFPLEYGAVRTPTSQWTVTASGAVLINDTKTKIKISKATIGRIFELGVSDSNNMGAAMAPAAANTIYDYITDTGCDINEYDAIFTGDLGEVGSDLLLELLKVKGIDISKLHKDCGLLIYDLKNQDVHAGGSGCGCSAAVLTIDILPKLEQGIYKKVLFCATGALLSPTSVMQGKNIPAIAHLLEFIT